MKNNPYEIFSNFILRTPIYSITRYKSFTSGKCVSDKQIKELYNDPIFVEAIYLASPSLYQEFKKWVNNDIAPEKVEKLKLSILKYFSRMSSRCTPYGLFAGCSVGSFSNESNIILKKADKHERHTRLDMNFLVALSQSLAKDNNVKNKLLFFPNSSIYNIGNKLRYVEYYYNSGFRHHNVVAIDFSFYLEKILDKAASGSTIEDLVSVLIDDDITEDTAYNYICDLIENQILISELEPSVSGNEFIMQIEDILKRSFSQNELPIFKIINIVNKNLSELDVKIGNDLDKYLKIEKSIVQTNR
jgi:hypothetical protein